MEFGGSWGWNEWSAALSWIKKNLVFPGQRLRPVEPDMERGGAIDVHAVARVRRDRKRRHLLGDRSNGSSSRNGVVGGLGSASPSSSSAKARRRRPGPMTDPTPSREALPA